jgi:predicted kinase
MNDNSRPTLHLLMGLPGAGKSTFAKLLQKENHAVRLSSDEYRLMLFAKPTFSQKEHDNLYGLIDHNVEHLLQSGHDVIYDANLNRRTHRDEKYRLAAKYNARVILWWLDVPQQLAKQRRIDTQDARLIPDGESSERMFDRVSKVMELPSDDEQAFKVTGIDLTAEKVDKLLNLALGANKNVQI